MKNNRRSRRVKVSADGAGLVSRTGAALLRELTVDTGLAAGWNTVAAGHLQGDPCRCTCRGGCWLIWR